jgi:hypothetical protein
VRPKCERCGRAIADCGFGHGLLCEHGRLQRICCWCVVELNTVGVDDVVIGAGRCPVVVLGLAAQAS